MPPETPTSPAPQPGLPPVQPPSVQVVLRLFLVPALIVAGLIGLFLAGPALYHWVGALFGRPSGASAERYVRDLESTNPDVRWRAALDLAQVLPEPRNAPLAGDARLALRVAGQLDQALRDGAEAEKTFASRAPNMTPAERAREEKALEQGRTYVMYLTACLGHFLVPAGVDLLNSMALQQGGLEPGELTARRERAVWALAVLGKNLQRFDTLSPQEQDAVEEQLAQAAESGDQARRASRTLDYVRKRRQGKPQALGVDVTLERCAADDDLFLRLLSALAASYWPADAREGERIERFLDRLASDDGRGEEKYVERMEKNPEWARSRPVVRRKGYEVRVQATLALARRGSPRVRPALLKEMLDEERLGEVFRVRRPDGVEGPDQAKAVETVKNALGALAELHKKRPKMDLTSFVPLVERLTNDPNESVRTEALKARLALTGRE
jgi:hypothetical protein